MAVKRWDGTKWVQQAGSTKPFYQANAPSSPVAGDIWIESDVDVPIYDGTYQTGNRNVLINGKFAVDQRNSGASVSVPVVGGMGGTTVYNAVDRWYSYALTTAVTGQRVAGSASDQYYYRFTGAATNAGVGFAQRIEALNSYHMAGKSATISVSLASSSLTSITWTAYYANTTDTFGTYSSPTKTQIATGTFTITSTLTRYSTTISVPSAATTGIEIIFSAGALTATNTLTFANAQFELGTSATPFEHRPYGQELALCQRYYYRWSSDTTGAFAGTGVVRSSSSSTYSVPFPVTMRATPTMPDVGTTAANWSVYASTSIAGTSLPANASNNNSPNNAVVTLASTGLTAGQGAMLLSNATNNYLGFSAEL